METPGMDTMRDASTQVRKGEGELQHASMGRNTILGIRLKRMLSEILKL